MYSEYQSFFICNKTWRMQTAWSRLRILLRHGRQENLSQILHFAGKKPKYYYIRTKSELEEVLKIFAETNYRYLHISCHGNETELRTTLEPIPFPELKRIVRPYLSKKRLFLSACRAVNKNLARAIIPSSKCNSIIGFVKDVGFGDAAIIWASFYHLVFREDSDKMKRKDIAMTLQKVANAFGISLNYFSTSESHGFKGDRIIPNKKMVRIYP